MNTQSEEAQQGSPRTDPIERLDQALGELRGRIIDMHIHPTATEGDMHGMLEQAKRAGMGKLIFSHAGVPIIPRHPTRQQIREFNEFSVRLRDRYPGWMDMYVYVYPPQGEGAVRDVEEWVTQHGAIAV